MSYCLLGGAVPAGSSCWSRGRHREGRQQRPVRPRRLRHLLGVALPASGRPVARGPVRGPRQPRLPVPRPRQHGSDPPRPRRSTRGLQAAVGAYFRLETHRAVPRISYGLHDSRVQCRVGFKPDWVPERAGEVFQQQVSYSVSQMVKLGPAPLLILLLHSFIQLWIGMRLRIWGMRCRGGGVGGGGLMMELRLIHQQDQASGCRPHCLLLSKFISHLVIICFKA